MASKVPSKTEHGTGSAAGEDVRPGQLTWRGAVGDVWRSVTRHKVISAVIAVLVVGSLAAIGVAGTASSGPGSGSGSGSSSSSAGLKVAAAFSLPALGTSGQRVALSAYAGKPLVVNFFASWCVPCKTETPRLAAFYRAEHGKVAIVGLDENDTQANALSFTQADKVSYPVGFDPAMTAASGYEVAALPQTFFLDARHRVVDRIFGAVTQAELDKGIALATKG
jgi:cytochrome c biogenesis protein CcmG/thiol:disulfide interchange protein DsbE